MIAVIQLSSTYDKQKNLNTITRLLEDASSHGAVIAFLPEAADYIARSRGETRQLAEGMEGDFIKTIKSLAVRLNLWISIGSMHRKPESKRDDERLYNSHMLISNEGKITGIYDKTHLFGIDLRHDVNKKPNDENYLSIQESQYIQPGNIAPVVIRGTPVGDLGLAICYDLRFPELAAAMRYKGGANVLSFPSAFQLKTGEAGHWHTLLRARAIETQSYVVAAAQEGIHHSKLTTYGHSLVVDPWGQIIAEREEPGPGIIFANIKHDRIPAPNNSPTLYSTDQVRSILPVASSRRFDIFPLVDAGSPQPIALEERTFGPHKLKSSVLFYQTSVSMAFVNISPLVPGHILVTPIDCIKRFNDLPSGTISDLFLAVDKISKALAAYFEAPSLCISIQDGEDAGQSVPHVHVHVLPRKPGDFAQNDDIYTALQTHDKVANRKFRSIEEMEEEAKLFRSFFYTADGTPIR